MERLRAFKVPAERLPHLEHLAPDQEPIFTTVEDRERISEETNKHVHAHVSDSTTDFTYLNYYGSSGELDENSILSSESKEGRFYLISQVDETWKFSNEYRNCQGIVVSGMTHAGKRVSFMTHQNPTLFNSQKLTEDFLHTLEHQLTTIKALTREGSVDAVLFGGDAYTIIHEEGKHFDPELNRADEYRIAAEIVAETINKILGFSPRIAESPRALPKNKGHQTALFDTQYNHLHVLVEGALKNSGDEIAIEDLPAALEYLRSLEIQHHKKGNPVLQ